MAVVIAAVLLLGGCTSMYEKCMNTGLYSDSYCRGLHDGWWSGHGRFGKDIRATGDYDEGWDDGMRAGTASAQRSATWGAAAWHH